MPARKGEHVQPCPLQKRTYRIEAQPQKRGAKPYFTGSRHDFLAGYCDEYIALRGKSRRQFWFKLFNEWWKRYPWRLPDNEEPPIDDLKKMDELAYAEEKDKVAKAAAEERLREVGLSD